MRAAIELFGSAWCPPCAKAKDVILSTSPESKGVSFTYIDVGEDPAYAMRSLPVIFIGDEKLDGPTEAQIRSSLNRLYEAVKPETFELPTPPESFKPTEDPNGIVSEPRDPDGIMVGAVFAVLGFVAYNALYDG